MFYQIKLSALVFYLSFFFPRAGKIIFCDLKKIFIFFPSPRVHLCTLATPGDLLGMGWHHLPSPLPGTGHDILWLFRYNLCLSWLISYGNRHLLRLQLAVTVASLRSRQILKDECAIPSGIQQQFLCHLPVIGPRNDGVTVLHNMQY